MKNSLKFVLGIDEKCGKILHVVYEIFPRPIFSDAKRTEYDLGPKPKPRNFRGKLESETQNLL
jgi:hypothetical protein